MKNLDLYWWFAGVVLKVWVVLQFVCVPVAAMVIRRVFLGEILEGREWFAKVGIMCIYYVVAIFVLLLVWWAIGLALAALLTKTGQILGGNGK